jgi:hypothetical protein
MITVKETMAVLTASFRLSFSVNGETKPRKIGTTPGGSIITKRVTNTCTPKVHEFIE